jgi:hypothetical protein
VAEFIKTTIKKKTLLIFTQFQLNARSFFVHQNFTALNFFSQSHSMAWFITLRVKLYRCCKNFIIFFYICKLHCVEFIFQTFHVVYMLSQYIHNFFSHTVFNWLNFQQSFNFHRWNIFSYFLIAWMPTKFWAF